MSKVTTEIQALIEPTITAMGFELVGVEYVPQGRHSVLRIYIDHEDGITVDHCGEISHRVSALLDVEDPIHGSYTLEVSSPGLDRPLFTLEHFQRFAGEEVELRLHSPRDGRRRFKGRLEGVENEQVVVEVEGERLHFDLDDIDKAHVVPQW